MVAKANKTLGLIKRICGRNLTDVGIRKLLYLSIVRPRLEYASNVWSPYTEKHRSLIENVQRRAIKFILNFPSQDMTYSQRLVKLNILPLEFRRDISARYFSNTDLDYWSPTSVNSLFPLILLMLHVILTRTTVMWVGPISKIISGIQISQGQSTYGITYHAI